MATLQEDLLRAGKIAKNFTERKRPILHNFKRAVLFRMAVTVQYDAEADDFHQLDLFYEDEDEEAE